MEFLTFDACSAYHRFRQSSDLGDVESETGRAWTLPQFVEVDEFVEFHVDLVVHLADRYLLFPSIQCVHVLFLNDVVMRGEHGVAFDPFHDEVKDSLCNRLTIKGRRSSAKLIDDDK